MLISLSLVEPPSRFLSLSFHFYIVVHHLFLFFILVVFQVKNNNPRQRRYSRRSLSSEQSTQYIRIFATHNKNETRPGQFSLLVRHFYRK